jgi:hypothetical protein
MKPTELTPANRIWASRRGVGRDHLLNLRNGRVDHNTDTGAWIHRTGWDNASRNHPAADKPAWFITGVSRCPSGRNRLSAAM